MFLFYLQKLKTESCVFLIVWVSFVFYSIYSFIVNTKPYFNNYQDVYDDFEEGWRFLQQRRDVSDTEFNDIIFMFVSVWPYMILGVGIIEVQLKYAWHTSVIKIVHILFTSLVIVLHFGFAVFGILVIQPIVYTVVFLIFKNKKSLYVWTIVDLILLGYTPYDTLKEFGFSDQQVHIFSVCTGWQILKCASFYLELKSLTLSDILNCFSYNFYLPTYFSGPVILYNEYEKVFDYKKYKPFKLRIQSAIMNHIRLIYWLIFTYFSLHYVYINAIRYHVEFLYKLNSWSLYGYGYLMGQYFHLKYVLFYGISTNLASFQNMEVPSLPRCIGRIHLYSDMWRYFDVGLYKFLVRYIYKPTLISKSSFNKIISSGITFVFIWIWHALNKTTFLWAFLNYTAVMCESVGNELCKTTFIQNLERKIGLKMMHRLKCLCSAHLMILNSISNFCFFAGLDVANIFVDRILEDSLPKTMVLIFAFYTLSEISSAIRMVPAATM